MTGLDIPRFSRLATDGDDSRWLADQAAQRRSAAARKARGSVGAARPTAHSPAQALRNPGPAALIGGGVALAAVMILTAPLLLSRAGPDRVASAANSRSTRETTASPPTAAGAKLDCYVNGVSLGVLSLAECAVREGRAVETLQASREPSMKSASHRENLGGLVEARTPDPEPLSTPPARLAQALPAPMRAPAPLLRINPPPRPQPRAPDETSAPYAERLDDAALASIDARPDSARASSGARD